MIETIFLKFDEDGINLKSNFQKDFHIDYAEIDTVVIKRGFLLKNWILVLLVGLLISGASFLGIIESIQNFDSSFLSSSGVRLYLLLQFVPWVLFIVALILIFYSLRRGAILVIYLEEMERYKVPIIELEKDKKITELVQFLNERVRVQIDKRIQLQDGE